MYWFFLQVLLCLTTVAVCIINDIHRHILTKKKIPPLISQVQFLCNALLFAFWWLTWHLFEVFTWSIKNFCSNHFRRNKDFWRITYKRSILKKNWWKYLLPNSKLPDFQMTKSRKIKIEITPKLKRKKYKLKKLKIFFFKNLNWQKVEK